MYISSALGHHCFLEASALGVECVKTMEEQCGAMAAKRRRSKEYADYKMITSKNWMECRHYIKGVWAALTVLR